MCYTYLITPLCLCNERCHQQNIFFACCCARFPPVFIIVPHIPLYSFTFKRCSSVTRVYCMNYVLKWPDDWWQQWQFRSKLSAWWWLWCFRYLWDLIRMNSFGALCIYRFWFGLSSKYLFIGEWEWETIRTAKKSDEEVKLRQHRQLSSCS